jgi:hypothetical protein
LSERISINDLGELPSFVIVHVELRDLVSVVTVVVDSVTSLPKADVGAIKLAVYFAKPLMIL